MEIGKNLRRISLSLGATAMLGSLVSQAAHAVPSLQIDILSLTTTYDDVNEDVVTENSAFILRVLGGTGGEGKPVSLGTEYRLSAAITPKTGPLSATLGSFLLNGNQIDATGDMTFGTPPVELFANPDTLPGHGIFDTFFMEEAFEWNIANVTQVNNVEDNPGGSTGSCDPQIEACLFFLDFSVDIAQLDPSVELHFDLYEPEFDSNGVITGVAEKAPFSHDANTNGRIPPPDTGIPEPATIALFGAGLVGFGFVARRRKRT